MCGRWTEILEGDTCWHHRGRKVVWRVVAHHEGQALHRAGGEDVHRRLAGNLRDAQAHPEKYENLQVRVAGWNIRWNDIPRKEQDEYIARIECVGR